MSKGAQFQTYDITLAALGTVRLPAAGQFFRIQSATGAVSVVGDFGRLANLLVGQGAKGIDFGFLSVTDTSGAPNSVKIIVGSAEFLDQQIVLSGAGIINTNQTPFAPTASFADGSALTANTPITVFLPGSNINGAILLNANFSRQESTATNYYDCFIAKSSAPTTVIDGSVIIGGGPQGVASGLNCSWGSLASPVYIPAGVGLYYMSNLALTAGNGNTRNARYRLL